MRYAKSFLYYRERIWYGVHKIFPVQQGKHFVWGTQNFSYMLRDNFKWRCAEFLLCIRGDIYMGYTKLFLYIKGEILLGGTQNFSYIIGENTMV